MSFLGFKSAAEKANAELLARGMPTTARVLDNKSVDATGHGERDQVSDLILEVQRPDGAPFRVQVRAELTFHEDLACCAGATVPVRFQPETGAVIVDLAAMARRERGEAEVATHKRAELLGRAPHLTTVVSAARRAQLIQRGMPARAHVLDCVSLPGGDDLEIRDLILDVQPPGGTLFRVGMRLALTFAEDMACFVGADVPVRFDPHDGTTIFDSVAFARKDDAELLAHHRAELLGGAPRHAVVASGARHAELLTHGVPARANILDCATVTGGGYGDRSEVRDLILDVQPVGGTLFRVGARLALTFTEDLACWVGNHVPVRFDPRDAMTVFDGPAFAHDAAIAAELAERHRAALLRGG